MSLRTLPLLYLNLGGEMMYVLDQRLVAQQVQPAKGAKVLDDIAATMFNRKFLEEIFLRHQALHNRGVLRAMFDKLANASIMRLSPNSMDKLYDLMVMAVKHQVLATRNPHDLVGVTLNHLDAIADYASSEPVKKNVEFAYELLIQSYCTLSTVEMQTIRFALLNFLQDFRVRVSVFLQEGKQNSEGRFRFGPLRKLQRGVEPPGRIRYFDHHGEVLHQTEFHPGLPAGIGFEGPDPPGGLGPQETGNRGTKHGLNMYANSSVAAATVTEGTTALCEASSGAGAAASGSDYYEVTPSYGTGDSSSFSGQHLAKQELDLLAKLIGDRSAGAAAAAKDTFRLSIFEDKMVVEKRAVAAGQKKSATSSAAATAAAAAKDPNTVSIDLKGGEGRKRGKEISNIIGEMESATIGDKRRQEEEEEEDLLALMDQAQ